MSARTTFAIAAIASQCDFALALRSLLVRMRSSFCIFPLLGQYRQGSPGISMQAGILQPKRGLRQELSGLAPKLSA